MYFPPQQIKYFVIIVVIVIVGIGIWMFFPSGTTTITANFRPTGSLQPDGDTTLHVEITNTLGKDVSTLKMTVLTGPNSIEVTGSPDTRTMFKMNERREFEFPLRVITTYPGTYSVEVHADMDGTLVSHTLMLDVLGG